MDTHDRNDSPEQQPTEPERADTPSEPAHGPQSPAPGPDPQSEPRRLTRSRDDRVLGGVCGGVARYFGLDATLVRIVAAALVLFGGTGAILYLAALVLMPNEPAGPAAAQPGAPEAAGAQAATAQGGERPRALVVVGVVLLLLFTWPILLGGGFAIVGLAVPLTLLALAGLLVWWLVSGEAPGDSGADIARRAALGIGVLFVCGLVATGGALAAGLGGGAVVASLVVFAGVMLVVGAFFGGLRWLILPALSLALAVGFVSAAGIDFNGGVGEREYRPDSAAGLRDRYELGMGELVVDLRGADLPAGDTPIDLDVGIGQARLIVPQDVCVASAADVGIGAVDVFDRENGGVDLDWEDRRQPAAGGSRVVVDADIGIGALTVNHDGSDDRDRGPPFGPRFGDRDDEDDEVGNLGCRGTRAAR